MIEYQVSEAKNNSHPFWGHTKQVEDAYRRGVHQAYGEILRFMVSRPDMDKMDIVRSFYEYAEMFRYDDDPDHSHLLGEIADEVHDDEVSRLISLGLDT